MCRPRFCRIESKRRPSNNSLPCLPSVWLFLTPSFKYMTMTFYLCMLTLFYVHCRKQLMQKCVTFFHFFPFLCTYIEPFHHVQQHRIPFQPLSMTQHSALVGSTMECQLKTIDIPLYYPQVHCAGSYYK